MCCMPDHNLRRHPNCRKPLDRGCCQSCQVSSTCKTLRYIRPRSIMDISWAAMMVFLLPSSHWLTGCVCRWTCNHSPKDRYRKRHYDLSYHPDSKYRTGSNLPPVSHWYWHRNTLPNKWPLMVYGNRWWSVSLHEFVLQNRYAPPQDR